MKTQSPEEQAWDSPLAIVLAPLGLLMLGLAALVRVEEWMKEKPHEPRSKRGPAYCCGCPTCCFDSPPADQAARKCSKCGTTLY